MPEKIVWNTRFLALPRDEPKTRKAFSTASISDKLFAPGALNDLNWEARAIRIGKVNAGYRPSTGPGLTSAQVRLDENGPRISIWAVGRTLKSSASRRAIPLLGVTLEAFCAVLHGFPRYSNSQPHRGSTGIATRTVFWKPKETTFPASGTLSRTGCLPGIDEFMERDLTGHSLCRESYGERAALEKLWDLLSTPAL